MPAHRRPESARSDGTPESPPAASRPQPDHILQGKGKASVFSQPQQNRQLFLKLRQAAAGRLRGKDEQPQQRLGRQSVLEHVLQGKAAERAVQGLGRRLVRAGGERIPAPG